jgi:hypothetical protein
MNAATSVATANRGRFPEQSTEKMPGDATASQQLDQFNRKFAIDRCAFVAHRELLPHADVPVPGTCTSMFRRRPDVQPRRCTIVSRSSKLTGRDR